MPEALRKIRAELGEEAVILHSKSMSGKGFRGLLQSPRVEVTAAADVEIPAKTPSPSPQKMTGIKELVSREPSVRQSLRHPDQRAADLPARIEPSPPAPSEELAAPDWAGSHRSLIDSGVPLPIARDLIREAMADTGTAGGDGKLEALRRAAAGRFKTCAPLEPGTDMPTVAVFIGPTGVGKTTTIAKIAAGLHLRGTRVALVTADTYRLAAVEQLRRFAEIMDLPVEVAYEARELPSALRRHRDAGVILVDTAGRSQNHPGQMSELAELLRWMRGAEVYLVLAASTSPAALEHQLRTFARLGAEKVILAKLDELPSGGVLLQTAAMLSRPIAYVTDGQEIPNDYWPADASRLAEIALAGILPPVPMGGAYAAAR